jgi:hypothetical protein
MQDYFFFQFKEIILEFYLTINTNIMKLYHVFWILLFFLAISGYAQSVSDTLYKVTMRDGNEYIGKIISRDEKSIRIDTKQVGEITLKLVDIARMEAIDEKKMVKGEYWADNPQSTRYFFSATGYGLKKGEGYYQNVWIFFNQAAVGITENFSLGAGTVPLFLFGEATPVWITPKFSIPIVKDKVHLGIGSLLGAVIGAESDNATFGLLYGSATFGSRDKNISAGIGWGFAEGEFGELPTLNLSFLNRVSKNWYIVSENYYFSGSSSVGVLSFGARWVPKVVGIDFGLVAPVGDIDGFALIPWLGFTVPFGKKKNLVGRNFGNSMPVAPFAMAAFK